MAKAIRNNVNIKGICVNNNEIKISQYADDTTLILDGSEQALLSALSMLDEFSKASGLKLNEKKTEALWIGSSIGNDKLSLPGKELKWPESKVKTLGLWLSVEPEIAALLNYDEKVEKIRKILSCWKYRRLTLLGRITVLKSLAASQLVYLLSPLPSNYNALNQINKLFYQFLWNGKGDKIKRKIMINDYCDGGLKMIDLISFNKALKTTWIKKYLDTTNNANWKIFFDLALKHYGRENIFAGNLNVKDTTTSIKATDAFLKEILEVWAEVNFEQQIKSQVQFQEQSLWHNSLIRIANKPIFFKDWCAKGITKVKHLQKPGSSNFLSLNDFQLKYSLSVSPLKYYGIISAVKTLRKEVDDHDNSQEYKPFCTKLLETKKVSSLVYKILTRIKGEVPKNSQMKWLLDCNYSRNENLDWSSAYLLTSRCTRSTKLIEFQFKFLHRRLATNDFLYKIGLKANDNCTFCQEGPESLMHLFWTCHETSNFWKRVSEWLQSIKLMPKTSTLLNITAFGLKPETSKFALQINYCLLLARRHIWLAKSKEMSPNFDHYLRFLKSRLELETKSGDMEKWEPLAEYIPTDR